MKFNKTKLALPFADEWLVFWGGDTAEQNMHHGETSQNFAFDFIKVGGDGKWLKNDGRTLEDYYAYGSTVLAPGAGLIIEAVDGIRDNRPGEINNFAVLGNYIMIKHSDDEYSILAHLKKGSVTVTEGSIVKLGQKMGACGNSGYSSDPHLHYHLQDSPIFARLENFKKKNVARAIKITFAQLKASTSGQSQIRTNYSPQKAT